MLIDCFSYVQFEKPGARKNFEYPDIGKEAGFFCYCSIERHESRTWCIQSYGFQCFLCTVTPHSTFTFICTDRRDARAHRREAQVQRRAAGRLRLRLRCAPSSNSSQQSFSISFFITHLRFLGFMQKGTSICYISIDHFVFKALLQFRLIRLTNSNTSIIWKSVY